MNLRIEYESESFSAASGVPNCPGTLMTSWNELLWAAVTVGRPNTYYVFRHGRASMYEALFRLSLIRMALEQSSPHGRRLRRTSAARTLDPSEKGAINYFLGLTICKLFAAQLLGVPWLLHLDIFRPMLNAVLSGRSRPDLIGITTSGRWVALECKGRVSPPDHNTKNKAKRQAQRLISVNGVEPAFQIAGIAYFRNEMLQFFWRDPERDLNLKNPIEVTVKTDQWRYYYMPSLDLIRPNPDIFKQMQEEPVLANVEDADIKIGICPEVLRALVKSQWEEARSIALKKTTRISSIPYQADGIAVVAGDSWLKPL